MSYVVNGTSDPSYFAYLDIVSGSVAQGTGDDAGFAFFGLELYGDYRAGESGVRDDDFVFGDGSQYRIRMSADSEGKGGLLIGSDAGVDYSKGDYDTWNTKTNYGWLDSNPEDVGGTGGVSTPGEGSINGYDADIIKSDGQTANSADDPRQLRGAHPVANDPIFPEPRPAGEFDFRHIIYRKEGPRATVTIFRCSRLLWRMTG